jgi:cardiolipin synthase A/B
VFDRILRKASQAHYDGVLKAGVKIYEYGPALLHAKTMVIDGRWVSIGSANIDNRSFALNNELNLTFFNRGLAAQLEEILHEDRAFTRPVSKDGGRRQISNYMFYIPLLLLRDQL